MTNALEFDHAGYAVESIQQCLDTLVVPLYSPTAVGPIIEDPMQQVRVCFVTLAGGARLELIEPIAESSPIRRMLNESQGGLYHCCFRTSALDETIRDMLERGFAVARPPVPAAAYGGKRIAFLYNTTLGLVELVES